MIMAVPITVIVINSNYRDKKKNYTKGINCYSRQSLFTSVQGWIRNQSQHLFLQFVLLETVTFLTKEQCTPYAALVPPY